MEDDNDLTLSAYYDKHGSDLSLLFPPLPTDYFKDKEDALVDNSKINSIADLYNNMPIKPYIKRRDLASGMSEQDCGGSKKAWEIGININF